MYDPVRFEELRIVQGHSGRGLRVVCACGCVNWNHLEIPEPLWGCRNCPRIFTHNFPELVATYLATQKQRAAEPAETAAGV